jgi:murein L,D-transpeptidase YcbB/YkuD
MAWRVAKSLLKFREQINAASPHRNKSSDGTVGDAAHASRSSDHNPWVKDGSMGIVTAMDITHDPGTGVDTWALAEFLRVQKDPRVKYVISNKRIWSSVSNPYQWRKYTGSNPHSSHMHVSVHSTKAHYDSERDWTIQIGKAPPDPDDVRARPVLKLGSRGDEVRIVQNILGITVDGIFGPATEAAVKKFQTAAKIPADGIIGPATYAAYDKIEQRGDGEKEGDALEE